MNLPSYFPNPERSQKLIDELLDRVRSLDPSAKKRLMALLEDEADLPMLDKVERDYREKVVGTLAKMSNRDAAAQLASTLRGHFVKNLNLQRAYLHELVRNVLQESIAEKLHEVEMDSVDSEEIDRLPTDF